MRLKYAQQPKGKVSDLRSTKLEIWANERMGNNIITGPRCPAKDPEDIDDGSTANATVKFPKFPSAYRMPKSIKSKQRFLMKIFEISKMKTYSLVEKL
ncbi:hypothetical protein ACJ73_09098 [Blastomyces percursus]|uniref:Uncharacterized protein n=1 Tax=Blastomyces percursus TaxID=1658174 RepID=A0A1J9PCN7_9EURO|nr:hypothetical protein ACJ73_09098 [Blastomyces percursus]